MQLPGGARTDSEDQLPFVAPALMTAAVLSEAVIDGATHQLAALARMASLVAVTECGYCHSDSIIYIFFSWHIHTVYT